MINSTINQLIIETSDLKFGFNAKQTILEI